MPVLAAAPSEDSAQELYTKASAKYSAADYESAIELFTAALEKATAEDLSYKVRGALLFNLARSHVKAYEEITKDIKNLRSARSIYKRYLDEADEAGGEYGDLSEAKAELARVEQMLEEEEKRAAERAAAARASGSGDAEAIRAEAELQQLMLEKHYNQAARHKTTGVALSVVGGFAFVGGIGLIAWGSTFKRFAEEEIENESGSDPSMYTPDQQDYLDGEISKGKIWMGAGAGAAVVGAAGIGLGVWQLMKAKDERKKADDIKAGKKAEATLAPVIAPGYSGISLSGRF